MVGDKIGGFTVVSSIERESTKYVMAKNPANDITPFATWEARVDDPSNYYMGHYFEKEIDAMRDYGERILQGCEISEFFKPSKEDDELEDDGPEL